MKHDDHHLGCPFCASYDVDRLYLASVKLDSCECPACAARWDEEPETGEYKGRSCAASRWSRRDDDRVTVPRIPIFDLDGTLLDSDAALAAPFVALGVAPEQITFGHVLDDECARLGISLDDYLDAYDPSASQPFAGVAELVADSIALGHLLEQASSQLGTPSWLASGWRPEVAMFADAFDGTEAPGSPVLAATGTGPASEVVFVGDTAHDRAARGPVGCRFVLAGWNPRATGEPGDVLAERPADVLAVLAGSPLRR